ncbi:MAG: hypothetical protein JOZ69_19440 [Myxococcales bacterium]|nr:hypothetical protein [Myxococcales bacterium]
MHALALTLTTPPASAVPLLLLELLELELLLLPPLLLLELLLLEDTPFPELEAPASPGALASEVPWSEEPPQADAAIPRANPAKPIRELRSIDTFLAPRRERSLPRRGRPAHPAVQLPVRHAPVRLTAAPAFVASGRGSGRRPRAARTGERDRRRRSVVSRQRCTRLRAP